MGDKRGKKVRNKVQKQKVAKKDKQSQKKQDKQPKATPWVESGFERARAK